MHVDETAQTGAARPVVAPTVPTVPTAPPADRMAAENFPVALRLLPATPRDELRRVYAYARFVDGLGDEADGDRLALLDAAEADVHAVWGGRPGRLDAVAGLAPLVRAHRMPSTPFTDLIEANRVDQRRTDYPSFPDLLGYCRLSANPVGRIVLLLADAANDTNVADSDAVCSALQILEHCQDVGEDARAGRVYLPGDELAAAGVAHAALLAASSSSALRGVVARQVERSLGLLEQGRPLVRRLSGWARFAVAGYVAGGLATAEALRRADFEVLAGPVRPSKAPTIAAATRLLVAR